MQRAIIVRGRLRGRTSIDLDEPVDDVAGEVEVVLRPVAAPPADVSPSPASPPGDVFDFIRTLRPGTRSKEDIDAQIAEERDSWGER